MDAQTILSDFVLGRVSPEEFERLLHSNEDLVRTLSENDPLPPYAGLNELYVYLVSTQFSSAGSLLNAKDVVSRFLRGKGVEITVPADALNELKLKLAVLPKWLSISDGYFKELLTRGPTKDRKELENWLKQEIREKFVCLAKPPRWLQAPDWQFNDGVPMIFVGQLDLTTVRHDSSFAYVFLDKAAGIFRVVEQTA